MRFLTLLLLLFCTPPLMGQGLVQAEALLKKGAATVPQAQALLLKLDLETRQTIDYHRVAALASQAAGEATTAADAVLVIDTMRKDGLDVDVGGVRTWLQAQAQVQYKDAIKALAAKDLATAVRVYIKSVRIHQSILGKDDQGLRDTALKALQKKAAKSPVQAATCFSLGVYAYSCGHLDQAATAFRQCVKLETDPYRKWRSDLLARAVDVERAHTTAMDAQSSRPSSGGAATPADTGNSQPTPPAGGSDSSSPRREEILKEIAELDAEIKSLSSADGWKHYTATDGRQRKGSVNDPYVKEKLEADQRRKASLEIELNNTR